jgi:hypothetical protein
MSDYSKTNISRVKDAVSVLYEHFDNVQIFANVITDDGKGTAHYSYGAGNWLARYGHIKSFVNDVEKGYILNDAINTDKKEWEE